MSRKARVVIPNIPHHVTQRGGRRQDVFFETRDRQLYLRLLKENADRYGVQVLAYVLMTNHVHHLVVPLENDSLRWTFQMTHKRYADHINARAGWSGHLWQERFYSSPVDNEYIWITTRYILRNPVEARLAKHAKDYMWSSVRAHLGLETDPVLTEQPQWIEFFKQRTDWDAWLSNAEDPQKVALLRKRTAQDLPTGSEVFLTLLQKEYGMRVRPGKLGRPKNDVNGDCHDFSG